MRTSSATSVPFSSRRTEIVGGTERVKLFSETFLLLTEGFVTYHSEVNLPKTSRGLFEVNSAPFQDTNQTIQFLLID